MIAEGEGCMMPCSVSLGACVQVAHIHLCACPCLGMTMTVKALWPLIWKVQVNLVSRWIHKYGIREQWFLFSIWGNNLNCCWQLKTTFGFFYLLMKSIPFPFCLLGTEVGIIFSSPTKFSNICREPIPFFSYFFPFFFGHTVQHVGS